MDTEFNFIGDDDDLDNIIERQGDMEEEQNDEDDDGPRGDDEAIEAPGPKKKDDKDKDELKKKKGTPRPKLDHIRLSSSRGLLALEAETRELKLRGRGHELQDIDLVLGKLQHWAHRLFPSYTFDDCLEKLEKLGSKKIVNVQLKKIRIGLESVEDSLDKTVRGDDYIVDEDDDEAPAPRLRDPDADFDDMMATARPARPLSPQPPLSQPAAAPVGLTEEQKERIMRNRLAAEERRLARLREQRERELREEEEAAAEEALADVM